MNDIAIRVEGLSKRYHIGGKQERYSTLRDTLTDAVVSPFRRARNLLRGQATGAAGLNETIWALKDVSFEVKQGEVVGIIGPNGAGKSTLLKVLSRITEPTEGYADIQGRVASLLEVGTGFHPELTGRENIYLNAAILGMRRMEIDKKFDEIVSFAEVRKFIDTPIKHYSSGMNLRLAFAVAAHLDPEILLIDEVLAVGDAVFQKKCLTMMGDVAKKGRTVLVVSHNMTAIQSLCNRAIWLDQGKIVEEGSPKQLVYSYLKTSTSTRTEQVWKEISTAPGNDRVRLRRLCVRPENGSASDPITVQTQLIMEFEYWNLDPGARLNLSLFLYNEEGVVVFNTGPVSEKVWNGRPFPVGLFRSVCHIPGDLLNTGTYRVRLLVVKNQKFHIYRWEDALVFDVTDVPRGQGTWYGKVHGVVRVNLRWNTDLIEGAESLRLSKMDL